MDAAARAELAALRRRAYSADADIGSDPSALARLVELEDALRAPAPSPPDVQDDPVAPAQLARPSEAVAPTTVHRWHRALIVTTAAAACVLGGLSWQAMSVTPGTAAPVSSEPPLDAVGADALALATDPQSTVLYTLRLDGAFGSYADPYPQPPPDVPIDKPLWASSLGEYYGHELWIAGTVDAVPADTEGSNDAEQLCIVLVEGSATRSKCVARAAWEQGALMLTIDFADLDPAERPDEMRADQSLGLWWTDDDRLRVLLGRVG